MKAYKLTNPNNGTQNDTQWGENVSHTATGFNKELCSAGWIHFYTDPLIAVFMNPDHANFAHPKLWECETAGEHLHEPLKSGCKTLTTIREIPLPEVTITQRIAFGILCAKEVYKDKEWNEWADKWLSGEDRSSDVAMVSRVDHIYIGPAAPAAIAAMDASAAANCIANNCIANVTYYAAAAATYAAKSLPDINFSEIAKKALNYI